MTHNISKHRVSIDFLIILINIEIDVLTCYSDNNILEKTKAFKTIYQQN